ncbi:TetR/AcrR family transcriptional regulator [Bradyrhizobium liaoningense]
METHQLILSAAAKTIREVGLARATTKLIARTAGVSEASIFKHFDQKNDLLLAVFRSQGDTCVRVAGREAAGIDHVQDNFVRLGRAALAHYRQIMPWLVASFADMALSRQSIADFKRGSHNLDAKATEYISEEQRLGRISENCEAAIIAEMLLAPCFRRAFRNTFGNPESFCPDEHFIADLVQVLAHAFVISKRAEGPLAGKH